MATARHSSSAMSELGTPFLQVNFLEHQLREGRDRLCTFLPDKPHLRSNNVVKLTELKEAELAGDIWIITNKWLAYTISILALGYSVWLYLAR